MSSRPEDAVSLGGKHEGWIVRESGRPDADHCVLLLPGALATPPFYDDLLAEPKLAEASIRFVATTLQGFGGTPPPDDLSMENYARLAGKLAADFGCNVVVGHSLGANVAIEMVAVGAFSGPLVLLSPSFSRADESRFPRALDRLGRVLGHLPYSAMLKIIGPAMKGSLPPHRRAALVAELQRNDPRFLHRQTRCYLEYLDRHGSLAPRLCDSNARTWVVFGDHDDIGLADDERRVLEECARVTLVTIADAGHFTLNEKPGRIAELVLDAVASARPTFRGSQPSALRAEP
jgi:pimeloyl-ACP methyl ester carboxylesterase